MAMDETGRLHKLLRGEIAAVQGYQKALADLRADAHDGLLTDFLDDHRHAVAVLSRHIKLVGEQPDEDAGTWGAFTQMVESAAALLDDAHTLKALKEGEVHGRDEYRTALGLESLPAPLREVVESELLPRQEEHIAELDAVIARLEETDARKSLPDRIHDREPAR